MAGEGVDAILMVKMMPRCYKYFLNINESFLTHHSVFEEVGNEALVVLLVLINTSLLALICRTELNPEQQHQEKQCR